MPHNACLHLFPCLFSRLSCLIKWAQVIGLLRTTKLLHPKLLRIKPVTKGFRPSWMYHCSRPYAIQLMVTQFEIMVKLMWTGKLGKALETTCDTFSNPKDWNLSWQYYVVSPIFRWLESVSCIQKLAVKWSNSKLLTQNCWHCCTPSFLSIPSFTWPCGCHDQAPDKWTSWTLLRLVGHKYAMRNYWRCMFRLN